MSITQGERQYVRVSQAACIAGVTETTVKGWVSAGAIVGAYRDGCQFLIPQDELNAVISARMAMSAENPFWLKAYVGARSAPQKTTPHHWIARCGDVTARGETEAEAAQIAGEAQPDGRVMIATWPEDAEGMPLSGAVRRWYRVTRVVTVVVEAP